MGAALGRYALKSRMEGDTLKILKWLDEHFEEYILSGLLVVLLLVNIFSAVWTANQFRAEAVLPDNANILIVWLLKP